MLPGFRQLRLEPLEPRRLLDGQGVLIDEFMAVNDRTLDDEDGNSSDWIEIFNPGPDPVDLGGWHLTDDALLPAKWTFDSRILGDGEYLVVFASGKDRLATGPAGEYHTNFTLNGDGEYLALVRPDGTKATEFAPAFPPQQPDVSFGIGREVLSDPLVAAGAPATVFVPADGSLGSNWTGAAANEPFDDSPAAGWTPAVTGIGYDTEAVLLAPTELIGHALIDQSVLDTAGGTIFMLESSFFAQPGRVNEWSIYSDVARSITPLIIQANDEPEYFVTGIGRSRTSDGTGVQQFAFDLQSGSAEVGQGYYFGWKDGSIGADNAGVVPFLGSTADSVRSFGQHTTFAVAENLGSGVPLNRTYSVQARSVLTDTPVPLGYWSFDGNLSDQSGNSHDAENHGASYSTEVPPALGFGRSLSFDGASDFVSALIDVSETSYTASMWFKTDIQSRGLFAVVDSDLGQGGNDRHIYFSGGNLATRVWNTEVIATSGQNFADGNWHHVAHVYGSAVGGQRIYVDGQMVASGTKSQSDFNWQKRINIGFSNDAAGDYFQGLVDDVSVWDSVLDDDQIVALAQGASPLAISGYLPLIETDVQAEMYDVNPSAYVRIPFQNDAAAEANELLLGVKYDDGFVAYLNGVEVARRNSPASPVFNSAATADRPRAQAVHFEEIALDAGPGLLRAGTNILALHALNDAADSADFVILPELLAVQATSDRYMISPSPGTANSPGVLDFVADTKFSVDRGLFSAPFSVGITTATQGADIYYTTDGSPPTPGAPGTALYTGAVSIGTTTTLRAAAFKEGYQPTNVDTHTYLFVADVANQPANPAGYPATWANNYPADYEVDPDVVSTTLSEYSLNDALVSIPTVSITTDLDDLFGASEGIYYNSSQRGQAWERPASVELIYPDGSQGFQIDAGLRMHGNSSRNHGFTPKHPIRVLFKSQYGAAKLDFPLFADSDVTRFDQVLLRGASTDSWPVVHGNSVQGVQRWSPNHGTYIRDQYMRDTQLAMGQLSAHGTYVHLYLNGLYWGLYNLAERPNNSFNAEYLGGNKDEYDVIKDFAELQDGTKDAWNQMIALALAGLADEAAYQQIQGNNPDGTRNPDYSVYLDVDSLIDYMILHIYSGAEDWPDHNWWAARRRGPESEGFKFFVWDQEISNDSLERIYTRISTEFAQPIASPSPSFLYGQAMANDTFRWQFIDRVHELLFNGGLLTPEQNDARWMARVAELDQAIVGESARWGDSKRAIPYKRETDWLSDDPNIHQVQWTHTTYFPQIHEISLQRFRSVGLYPNVEAPTFNQHGGQVPLDFPLEMAAPQGPIFYTLDGSDPRRSDGSVAPGALLYAGAPVSIAASAFVTARVHDGGNWSAATKATFLVSEGAASGSLVITELNYNPYDPTSDELAVDPVFTAGDFEFVELTNRGTASIDLSGVVFTDGVDFQFPDGSATVLAPGEFAVLVSNAAAFTARYGNGPRVIGQFDGSLNNGGEAITMTDRFGQVVLSFFYDNGGAWPGRADGKGASLEVIDTGGNYNDPANWQSSNEFGGSPGAAGTGPVVDIVVNEVLTHTDLPDVDSIELFNATGAAINIGGWFLSDTWGWESNLDNGNYRKFRIPDGTTIPAGGYLVFGESDFNSSDGNDPLDFALSAAHGDDLWLMQADAAGRLTRFADHVQFGAAANGESFGRWPNGDGVLYPMLTPTLGETNSGPRVGPVIISEVMYHPSPPTAADRAEYEFVTEDDLEYIEIYNPTDQTVELENWRIRGGIDYDFPADASLVPNQARVILSFDPDETDAQGQPLNQGRTNAFRSHYGLPRGIPVYGGYSGKLSDGGERVQLQRPDEPPMEEPDFVPRLLEDEVFYDDALPWPAAAAGGDQALGRYSPAQWGHGASSWVAATPTPGRPDNIVNLFDVAEFISTPSGFVTRFDRPFDSTEINLYDVEQGIFGLADVTLVGDSVGPVAGSVIFGPDSVSFIATGGPLPADTYTVTLRSAANGFRDLTGQLLDGNRDNLPGGDYVNTFIAAPEPIVVGLADFSRGPGQPVNLPATFDGLPLVVTIGPAAGAVKSIALTLAYDPALLEITAAAIAEDAPGGAALTFDTSTPGQRTLTFSSPLAPLTAGSYQIAILTAAVPAGADHGRGHAINVIGLNVIDSGDAALAATADAALHAVAYFGDTTGNASYSGLDAQRVARVGVGLDSGFEAYPNIDPVIVGDITGNGLIGGLDAQRIALEAVGIGSDQIPPLAGPLRLAITTLVDPTSGVGDTRKTPAVDDALQVSPSPEVFSAKRLDRAMPINNALPDFVWFFDASLWPVNERLAIEGRGSANTNGLAHETEAVAENWLPANGRRATDDTSFEFVSRFGKDDVLSATEGFDEVAIDRVFASWDMQEIAISLAIFGKLDYVSSYSPGDVCTAAVRN